MEKTWNRLGRKLFFYTPIIVVLITLISCIQNSKTGSSKEDSEVINSQKGDSSIDFDYENSIELRNADLWLNKNGLKKLVLDGEIYTIDMEVITTDDFTRIGITYPLITLDGEKIYDLEKETEIITLSKIVDELKKVWGSKVAVEDYDWYQGPLEPDNFTFIDNVQYTNDKGKVCITMHSSIMDTFDSMVSIYDTDADTITFISNPFFGQVTTVSFSDGAEYLAYSYTYYTGKLFFETGIDIIESETMKCVHRTKLSELVFKDNDNSNRESLYRIDVENFYWQEYELNAKLEIHKTVKPEHTIETVEIVEIKVWPTK